MSPSLFRVAIGSLESAVGFDGTLWGTCSYSEKFTTHPKIALLVIIRRRPLLALSGVSDRNQVRPSEHRSSSCVH